MTKAAKPISTIAPVERREIGDADLREWEAQRQAWEGAAEAVEEDDGHDDEVARLLDVADEYATLLMRAPCGSALAAKLKVEALQRALCGFRDAHGGDLGHAAEQVLDWLERAPAAANQAPTAQEMAALFDASELRLYSLDECPVPSNAEWLAIEAERLPVLRMAWATMSKTKAELLEIAESLFEGDEEPSELVVRFQDAERYFDSLRSMAADAERRIMMALGKVCLAEPDGARQ